jgi:predicted lysophospholipase L1 biosynthesis ABC-type transport system permease subunit
MKYTAIFALLLIVSAMGDQTEMSSKIQNLLSSQAKVADAVDSALEVLRDLRQVNIDAQNRADALNESQEASCKTMTG